MLFFSISCARRSTASYRWICDSYLCTTGRRLVSSYSASTSSNATAWHKLPDGPARTRFAPSPTGYLHLGSLRTALFNYLLAKSTGGQFLVRIEDTDQKRTIADAEVRLYQDLHWAGLQCDEGPNVGGPYGPYKQSQRTALYREHAEILLRTGHAYRCFCSPERLYAFAKQRTELGLPTDYDRACTHLSNEESEGRAVKGEAHVLRFLAPLVYPSFKDIVHGQVRNRLDQTQKAQLYPAFEDPILLKSDGFPTYHLANVVDDHYMHITHVVRGAEWLSSTPKHLALYNAFQWTPPSFAHVGLLTDQNHQKLSKRNMDIDISTFREKMGIFPETLTNYAALLGWSHQKKNDVMDLQELIDNFSMKFTKGDIVVTFEKMWFLQKAHAERYARSQAGDGAKISLMTDPVVEVLKAKKWIDNTNHILGHNGAERYVTKIIRLDARNYTNASEFVERNKYFFQTPTEQDLQCSRPSGHLRHMPVALSSMAHDEVVHQIRNELDLIIPEFWTAERLHESINTVIALNADESIRVVSKNDNVLNTELLSKAALKSWSKLVHGHLRWAITAGLPGPDGAACMQILGKKETMARLLNAVAVLKASSHEAAIETEVA